MNIVIRTMWRGLKIMLAAILISVSIWALLLPPLFPVSSRALVNAKIVTLEALVDGVVTSALNKEKGYVTNQDTLFVLTKNQSEGKNNLNKLLLDKKNLTNQLAAVDGIILSLKLNLENLVIGKKQQVDTKKDGLQVLLEQKKILASLSKTKFSAKLKKERELIVLYNEGIITQAVLDKATNERLEAERVQLTNIAGIEQIKNQLITTQGQLDEIVLGSSIEELPDAGSLASEIRKYQQQHRLLKNKLSTNTLDIKSQKVNLQSNSAINIDTPVSGLFWKQNVIVGQTVTANQSLAEVADNSSLFIEAYMGRHFLDSMSIGDRAIIYMINDKQFHEGRVERIEVEDTNEVKNIAISTIAPNPYMLKLIISIAGSDLSIDKLGQLARVMVGDKNPSLLEKGMIWLSFLLRSHK